MDLNTYAPVYQFSSDQLAYCSADERASLALYFLSQGELSLLKGDLSGLDLFEQAAKLDPCNPELFYRQGLALFEYGSEEGKEKALLLASKQFKTATTLCPAYFDAWLAWGNTLAFLGITQHKHHYFLEAEEKLKKAIEFSQEKPTDILADLHWDYGVVWNRIGVHSGEAMDLQLALNAFHKACQYQENLPEEFWNNYGNVCLQMSDHLNDIRLNVKAINCFKHAVSISISSYEGWIQLAHALKKLYAQTHDEDHFAQANDCFASASHLKPQETQMWFEWARFLCESGSRNCDLKRLRACIEKCQLSYACNPNQPPMIAIWAEALAMVGELTDRVDLIYEAENKISEAIELSEEDDPDIWYSYGMCLNSFARYFGDIDYFYQAIEKFQYGLSIDRTCHRHWYAVAKAYVSVGEEEDDIDSYEKAVRFYAKALGLHSCSFYIFDYAFALSRLGEMKEDQKILELAVSQFEQALHIQKNALYFHPDWLFHYAEALDILGDFYEYEAYYLKSIEILSHVLMVDPDFPTIHHRLALAFSHLGELMNNLEYFYRAVHHFRLAAKHEEDNDQMILDFGVTLINLAQHLHDPEETDALYLEADHKLMQAAKLGNQQAFYHLGCLNSILGHYDRAMHFLEKSYATKTLPAIDELLDDEWLDGLRNTSPFQEFLSHLKKR